MVELELDGLHPDGEHLVLLGTDGQRYRVVIDERLRAAVRRDRPAMEHLRATGESPLRPRDIQSRIRAGASAEDVAHEGGVDVELVRRYEGPVLAERTWIAQQTRALAIGREVGAPTLGDLVVDRLAARGADPSVIWDAVRRGGEPWQVIVRFAAGGADREARWQIDLQARSLVALDDESRWLSETELGGSASQRRHLSAVRARLYDVETDADVARGPLDIVIRDARHARAETPEQVQPARPAVPEPESVPGESAAARAPEPGGDREATDRLLADLDATRGTRVSLDLPDDSDADDIDDSADPLRATPETQGSPGPAASPRPTEASDALFDVSHVAPVVAFPGRSAPTTQEGGADVASPVGGGDGDPSVPGADPGHVPTKPAAPRARARGKRTSVPSWDEIVFGAKQD